MADFFFIKKGADFEAIKARLKNKDGTTATLTGATIAFSMRRKDNKTVKINAQAATLISGTPPVDPDDPNVSYSWQSGDTDTAGVYEGEWKVTYSGSEIQIFPEGAYNQIHVLDDVP